MTDEQADELLRNNDWAKWSDARELVLIAAGLGAAAERARWTEAVMAELDGNGQAHAIVAYAPRA